MESLPPCPNAWMSDVLATVGVPPVIDTAPPLTRRAPAAFRLITMLLFWLSPMIVSISATGEKTAVTDINSRDSIGSMAKADRARCAALTEDRRTDHFLSKSETLHMTYLLDV